MTFIQATIFGAILTIMAMGLFYIVKYFFLNYMVDKELFKVKFQLYKHKCNNGICKYEVVYSVGCFSKTIWEGLCSYDYIDDIILTQNIGMVVMRVFSSLSKDGNIFRKLRVEHIDIEKKSYITYGSDHFFNISKGIITSSVTPKKFADNIINNIKKLK